MSTIYIHWPFCVSKCHYCDFNSVACSESIDFDNWLESYKTVLHKFHQEFYKQEDITSVYFGGGTPSLLPVSFVEGLLNDISEKFRLTSDAEITLEANPKTIDINKAVGLRDAGINRLSVGVQSLIGADLKILGRIHSAKDAIDCVHQMSGIFNNLSIDMIYNRPQQQLANWRDELKAALKLPITHISLYELIVEDDTPLKAMIESGELEMPVSGSEFMEESMMSAEANEFHQYEISNFSKDGFQGKHNLSYWNYEDYYGIGPGAHSRITRDGQKIAIPQVNDIKKWLEWVSKSIFNLEILSEDDVFKEMSIMGLRSSCGLDATKVSESVKKRYRLNDKLEKLLESSYIIFDEGKIVLTREGMLRLNLVVEYLVS